jgi:aminopeptidase-like protein
MKNPNDEAKLIEAYFDRLWPLPRSITGEGVRQTHDILNEICPLERHEIPSGTQVLDWTIPPEWRVNHAYLIMPDGKKILDFNDNNLYLLNYSIAFKGTLSRQELEPHLYSIPDQPDAIPYRTSYYNPKWGFCLPHALRQSLPDGEYRVEIETEHFDGSLTLSEAILPGESDEEVLFSSYTCHPSLAINELSGPLLTAFLYRRIAGWKERRLTYRFLFAPETIGAIAYLAKRGDLLKQKLKAGYVITCVGDNGAPRMKRSKRGNTEADRAAEYVLKNSPYDYRIVDFTPSGSDERQYCSIGFDLPFASLSRTTYGEFPEYHTSNDNKALMDFLAMSKTLDLYENIARALDMNLTVKNKVIHGEPQMSKYGNLYKSQNHAMGTEETLALKWLIHYADGTRDLLEIAHMSKIALPTLFMVAQKLLSLKIAES